MSLLLTTYYLLLTTYCLLPVDVLLPLLLTYDLLTYLRLTYYLPVDVLLPLLLPLEVGCGLVALLARGHLLPRCNLLR